MFLGTITLLIGALAFGPNGTDLAVVAFTDRIEVESSTGNDDFILAATAARAGVMTATDKARLDGITGGGTSSTRHSATLVLDATALKALTSSPAPLFAAPAAGSYVVDLDILWFKVGQTATATPPLANIGATQTSSSRAFGSAARILFSTTDDWYYSTSFGGVTDDGYEVRLTLIGGATPGDWEQFIDAIGAGVTVTAIARYELFTP